MSIDMNMDQMMKMLLQNQKNIQNQQKIQKLQQLVQEKKSKENKVLTDAKKTRMSKNLLYQNSQYDFERLNKKTLIIDVSGSLDSNINFNIDLIESFKIDRLSDVYLDTLITFNALDNKHSGSNHMCFILGLNDFNIHTGSNSDKIQYNIIIPNESTADNTVDIHKSKKHNFICSVNPCTITTIEGSISNLINAVAFASSGRFILELLIIDRD